VVVIHVLSKQNTEPGNPYQQTELGGLGSGFLAPEDGFIVTSAVTEVILAVEDIPVTSEENLEQTREYVMPLPEKTAFNVEILRNGKVENNRWFK